MLSGVNPVPSKDSLRPRAAVPVAILPETLASEAWPNAGLFTVTFLIELPATMSPLTCPVIVNPAIEDNASKFSAP